MVITMYNYGCKPIPKQERERDAKNERRAQPSNRPSNGDRRNIRRMETRDANHHGHKKTRESPRVNETIG